MEQQTRVKRRVKKRKKSGFFGRFISLLLLIALGTAGYFAVDIWSATKEATSKMFQALPGRETRDVAVHKEPFTMLLTGIDEQQGGGRSDVMMLATINPTTKQVSLMSIPRDTYAYIPSVGYKTKLNHSYGHGGIKSTIESIEQLLDMKIDYYIQTNFEGFEAAVNAVGGVYVQVPFDFEGQTTGTYKWVEFKKGPMYLRGKEALAYVRMRKQDPRGDFGRNERQKQVIRSIIARMTDVSNITRIDDIMLTVSDHVKTDMKQKQLLDLLKLYASLRSEPMHTLRLTGENYMPNGVYYYKLDEAVLQRNVTIMKDILAGKKVDFTAVE